MIQRDLTIAIVYSLGDGVHKGEERDLLSVQETVELAHCVEEALNSYSHKTIKIPVRSSLEHLKRDLALLPASSTFVFNFCEDFGSTSLEAARVAHLIEDMGFMYTGRLAGAIENCVDKAAMKSCLTAHGVPTPTYQIFETPHVDIHISFPAIVKPVAEDASCGIDLASVVTDPGSLRDRVSYILQSYRQPALVEQFISGRELTVSIMGNEKLEFLPISEIDYSDISNPLERIRTYDSKWVENSPTYNPDPYHCPADLSPELAHLVYKAAGAAYLAVGMRDYGRVDLRLSAGRPYVLEINEAPDLGPGASFPASALAAGYTYAQMVDRIFQEALTRENRPYYRRRREQRHAHRQSAPYYQSGAYYTGMTGD
jgi:D-alanine-D-alanine ligase